MQNDLPLSVTVITNIPSPYQVELFNALESSNQLNLSVIYAFSSSKNRRWDLQNIQHEHLYLDSGDISLIEKWVAEKTLVVFSGYRQTGVKRLMRKRNILNKPWAFWGERPGFNYPGWFGRLYRKLMLKELYFSRVPIWGIGQWATEGYLAELGNSHRFFNMPYFSNLTPFFNIKRVSSTNNFCRFLFSGQFIKRKGVDLLISAFNRLLNEEENIELNLLGGGKLENSLRKQVSSCSKKVRFHGFKQWHEIADIYAQSDVLCAPSLYDGWGLIVPEGLAAGMPVISTDKTGAALELIDETNGWLIPAGNGFALYEAMKSAVAVGSEKRGKMIENAREKARQHDIGAGVDCFINAVKGSIEAWQNKPARYKMQE